MIIPVRCFTCGKVLAGKWEAYVERSNALAEADGGQDKHMEGGAGGGGDTDPGSTIRGASDNVVPAKDVKGRSARGYVMDELGITRLCCRRHFLSNVDLMDVI